MLTSSTRKAAILENPKERPRFFRKILMALEMEGGVGEDRYLAERIIYLEVWSVWTPFVILL